MGSKGSSFIPSLQQELILKTSTECDRVISIVSWVLLQAVMMDTLISVFVEELKQKRAAYTEETDRPAYDTSTDSDGTKLTNVKYNFIT